MSLYKCIGLPELIFSVSQTLLLLVTQAMNPNLT